MFFVGLGFEGRYRGLHNGSPAIHAGNRFRFNLEVTISSNNADVEFDSYDQNRNVIISC